MENLRITNEINAKQNPLGTEPIGRLLKRFAMPAIISLVISALYNIVDQIFIGHGVGILGNAATNIAFPLSTICISAALLIGIGTAANFNLEHGRGNKESAAQFAANGFLLLVIFGTVITIIASVFIKDLLILFGSTDDIYPYAYDYVSIVNIGMPFLIFTAGASHIIRADGSPTYSMIIMLVGAVINTILDPIFIFVCKWGMFGAALATIIGQFVSAVIAFLYIFRFKLLKFKLSMFIPAWSKIKRIFSLGVAPAVNQAAITIVVIALNNIMRTYGATSIYGSDIPLAVVGVVSKVNIIYIAIVVGISQGCQPIIGYNYGAKTYDRVLKTYRLAIIWTFIISIIAFLVFQIFPRQITSLFGSGDELYYKFATSYFRIFMCMTWANALQPLSSGFFTSIGRTGKGVVLSLSRHIFFLLPLLLILPPYLGLDGILYSGPIADGAAALICVILIIGEIRKIAKQRNDFQHVLNNA
ncbi:MAG: MATE family efflux transporter [Christensenellaceae bacterium]|jgi:putative MATE family efflux protein|nr:MATE family efflux transporter [Christensenellaceae bacterium]